MSTILCRKNIELALAFFSRVLGVTSPSQELPLGADMQSHVRNLGVAMRSPGHTCVSGGMPTWVSAGHGAHNSEQLWACAFTGLGHGSASGARRAQTAERYRPRLPSWPLAFRLEATRCRSPVCSERRSLAKPRRCVAERTRRATPFFAERLMRSDPAPALAGLVRIGAEEHVTVTLWLPSGCKATGASE